MKVIDSSALIKYVAKEENWEKVEEHIKEHIKEGCITLDLAAIADVEKYDKGFVDALTLQTMKKNSACAIGYSFF